MATLHLPQSFHLFLGSIGGDVGRAPQRTRASAMDCLAAMCVPECEDLDGRAFLDSMPQALYIHGVFGYKTKSHWLERTDSDMPCFGRGWCIFQMARCRPGQACLGGMYGWAGLGALLTLAYQSAPQGATLGDMVDIVRNLPGSPFTLTVDPISEPETLSHVEISDPLAGWWQHHNATSAPLHSCARKITRAMCGLPAKRSAPKRAKKVA